MVEPLNIKAKKIASKGSRNKCKNFKFDENKSMLMKDNPKRGIDFYEVQEIWSHPYYEDFRSDDPEQFRAIG